MIVLGIDPGMSGGWAIINAGLILSCGRSPQMKYGKRSVTDGALLVSHIMAGAAQAEVEIDEAVVEMVGVMPGQGGSSGFSFGLSTGAAVMASQLCAVTNGLVTPQIWKAPFGLASGKEGKRQALQLVQKIFRQRGRPIPVDFNVLANEGIAAAALIARWYTERRVIEKGLDKRPVAMNSKVRGSLRKVEMAERFAVLRHEQKINGG